MSQQSSMSLEASNHNDMLKKRVSVPQYSDVEVITSEMITLECDITQKDDEVGHDIVYRSCSWQHTSGLVFSAYMVLAIFSFPWSYSILGLIPGLILTVAVAASVLYTSLIVADYALKYPQLQNMCDIAQHLFWGSKIVRYIAVVLFMLNNIMIQGVHVLVGTEYLNTVTNHSLCSAVFGVLVAIISLVFSIPRTFSGLSTLATFSAVTMFISVILTIVFVTIQPHPAGYRSDVPVEWHLFPPKGTTFVQAMNALLNIIFTFAAQMAYPQFMAEMKNPKQFKKILWALFAVEVVLYSVTGAVIYVYIGNAYMKTPTYGALTAPYKIIAFSFAIPTIIFVGALYANITVRFLFFGVFKSSKHLYSHTVKGWAVWLGLQVGVWVIAYIVAEVIPFFSDLLSLMCALFACWFGYVFWGRAAMLLLEDKYGRIRWSEMIFKDRIHYALGWINIVVGIFILGPGLYAAVDSIVLNYQSGMYGNPFSCASNGL